MSTENKILDSIASSKNNKPHCGTCSLSSLCLPIALQANDLDALDQVIKRGRPIQKGEMLFKQGDDFNAVFAIRTGAVKSFTVARSGEEQITGFHLASELVGLSGYAEDVYPLSADKLEVLCDEIPGLRKQIMRNMSGEIRQDQQMMLQLSKKSADERLAYFLLELSGRFERRGFSAKAFRLAMSRVDISNYLGLAVETVSRIFTRFQKNGLIATEGKEITLLNLDELNNLTGNPSLNAHCDSQ